MVTQPKLTQVPKVIHDEQPYRPMLNILADQTLLYQEFTLKVADSDGQSKFLSEWVSQWASESDCQI